MNEIPTPRPPADDKPHTLTDHPAGLPDGEGLDALMEATERALGLRHECLGLSVDNLGHTAIGTHLPPKKAAAVLRDVADQFAAEHGAFRATPEAERLAAILKLATGRPAHHTVTVAELLSVGIGGEDEERPASVDQAGAVVDAESTRGVLAEVAAERTRQDEKWGEQNHPDGTGLPIYQHSARRYQENAQRYAALGAIKWRDVLLEEVYEALAESDPAALRTELVQVAAVAACWIEAIDRRQGGDAK